LRLKLWRWQDAAMTTVAVDCLILVDLQIAFVTGPDAVPDAAVVLAAATNLLDRARQARSLIIHLQDDGAPGTEDEPHTLGWALYLKPAPGEIAIRKATDDGFEGTDLGEILAASRIRRLAITGVMSEMCVSATARSALHRGLAVVLPHDAHATYDIPAQPGIGPAIPAATVSRGAEWALGDQLELPSTGREVQFASAPPDGDVGSAGPVPPRRSQPAPTASRGAPTSLRPTQGSDQ
jgi:streptothricin hydrolase